LQNGRKKWRYIMRFGTFGQKFQGVFERVKKLRKEVSKLVQEHRKVYRKKEMKIVMRRGTFVNYFWTKVPRCFRNK
jgi:hypothetical protein